MSYPHSLNVRSGIVGSDVLNAEARMGTPLSQLRQKAASSINVVIYFAELLCQPELSGLSVPTDRFQSFSDYRDDAI